MIITMAVTNMLTYYGNPTITTINPSCIHYYD